jgi:membrane protease YdiL (CAAX protease family)
MNAALRKIAAVAEVSLVAFVCVPFLARGVYSLFPGFKSWETDAVGFDFPVFIYVIEAGLALLAIRLHGKKPADYGLHFRGLKYQLGIAGACFFPVVLSNVPLAAVNYKTWGGAVVMAAVEMGLLLVLALILRKKAPVPALGMAAAWVLIWPTVSGAAQVTAGKAIAVFLTYALFVGFGEEILFRGYMHSHLNEVFGKPYRFFDVTFGWGTIITALLFGVMHFGVLRWIVGPFTGFILAWGFWTFFAGLVNGYVREKSGGILAPALLHGLPQAIATVALLFLL